MLYFSEYPSPLGTLLLTGTEEALTGLFTHGEAFCREGMSRRELVLFARVKTWLDGYFRGENTPMDFPLAPGGTDFQLRIWALLREIPYGQTVTYGELAKRISPTMSAQAVGQAVGKNPISIIVPCHRVIGADGTLVGYAGGLEKKAWLLHHEEEHR